MAKIKVENTEITVVSVQNEDYISLTDMAHSQMQEHIVFRWMSLKSTIEYLGEWEMLYNPNFNCTEFDTIRNAAGSNNFVLSVKAYITPCPSHRARHDVMQLPNKGTLKKFLLDEIEKNNF